MRSALLSVGVLLLAAACSKPSVEDCRKAIFNVQHLRGLDTSSHPPDPEVTVRRCRSTGKVDTVKCLIAAKTLDEVNLCEKK